MEKIIFSLIPLLVIIFFYINVSKGITEKEKKGNADVSDAFLLLLIGMTGIPFGLIFIVVVFVEILK